MERRRGSGTIRAAYSATKRFMALFLVAALILTNIGTELNVSYASSGEEVTFQLRGADLIAAVNEAIMDGDEVTAEDLDFTNGKVAQFEQTFFDGGQVKVYEVFPEMEGGSMDAELRIFVRLPEDADDMYTVTGDEELILLYVNNGSESISCNSEIIRIDNGTEKVKKTKRVTVRSYEDAFGDEEINIISKPVEETQAPEGEVQAPAVDGTQGTDNGETAAPTEDTGKTETGVPDDSEGTDETASSTEPSADGTESTEETTVSGEVPSETEKEEPAKTEAAGTEAPEKGDSEKVAHDETEAPEKEAPEKEDTEADKADAAEPVASITRHYAPVVADKEEAGKAEKADAPKDEKAAEKKETEAKETEAKETEAKETEVKETEVKETEGKEAETTESAAKEETAEAPSESKTGSSEDAGTAAPSESKEDMTSADGSTETSTEAGSSAEEGKTDSSAAGEITDAAGMTSAEETVSGTTAPSETETQAPVAEETVSKAGTSDLVGMGYCSTAKVYTTTINQLKALDDIEGYKVSYTTYPETSARIVDGARGVGEGESLTFGVKNQAGYEVQDVTVNDEEIEAETVTDNEDGSRTVWYTVPEVYEELNVQVYMFENLEHPAFDKSVEVNGVTIRITAPEGVLPANTDIQAEEITEQVAPAVTEVVSAESDNGTSVSTVIAYDINLVYDGMKLDNSWATDENSYVNVSFSGGRIAQASKDADEVEILHVETPTETVEAVSAVAELEGNDDNITVAEVPVLDNLTADDITIDSEGRKAVDVSGDASVDEIDFTTSHFSAFTVVFKNAPHLVIANELMEGSTGSEKAVYNYEVKLTPGTGRERFYYLAEDGEAVEAKAEDITKVTDDENGSITYSFKLNAGGRVKIGNVSLNAEYQVSQGEVEHNTLEKVSTIETKLDWSEIESENTTVTDKEVFPYGYNEEQGAYGSLMERAGALMRAYRKCREYDEAHNNSLEQRRRLIGNKDVSNTNIQIKLVNDHFGAETWPLAKNEGFQDVVKAAQDNLDKRQEGFPAWKKVDLTDCYLNIYFRTKTANSEDMEMVPYLLTNMNQKWKVHVMYNSADQVWYQNLATDKNGKFVGQDIGNDFNGVDGKGNTYPSMSLAEIIERDNSGRKDEEAIWVGLIPGEVNEPDYPEGSNSVEGTFVQSGDLRSITIEFFNHYNLVTDGGNTNIPDGDNTTTPPTDNNNPTPPDDDNTTTPPDDNNTTTQPGDDANTTPPADTGNGSGNADGSSSGGTSGSGSAGRYQNTDSQSGPGAQMTTITSEDVPLAALPVDAAAEASQAMALIDDGEIPLAAVPKTGDRSDSAHELAFILSGVLLAVYTALGNRKKKES